MAKPSHFRLGDHHVTLIDALAVPHGGVRSDAVRDAIAYWHRAVSEAGAQNALDLSPDEWSRLARLNDPGPVLPPDEDDGPLALDWSRYLAHELAGQWEGRRILPLHEADRAADLALARRIAGWGVVRGYALWAALRTFWRTPDSGVGGGDWWHPETWLTPTAKEQQ